MTVYVDDHQLLIGDPPGFTILYPELDGDFLDLAIEQLSEQVQSPFNISPKTPRW
jgi:formate C-acetyltransferase